VAERRLVGASSTRGAERFPVVYMLNGFNGSDIEWEARDIDTVLEWL
jgi:hypothetical protein